MKKFYLIMSSLLISTQLNAVGFNFENPLSEENKQFTWKAYRATCKAHENEKKSVQPSINFELKILSFKQNELRSKLSGLSEEIKTKNFWGTTVNAKEFLGQNYDGKKDLDTATKLDTDYQDFIQRFNIIEEKEQKLKNGETIFPELGDMKLVSLNQAKAILRSLVNEQKSLTSDDAISKYMALIKLGFDNELIEKLITKYEKMIEAYPVADCGK
ncbi:hypothetical protein Bealeia1_01324 [Candidatus Bealeia paramacronuclearis]|uniref:Uncharacterized protein n=1 Tax=Candidatus Bealeia paramacronuclearis TaxID=1921001 RepID=A0ABZ2C6W9_9PROT|nr:hypothetical protein [Candidatus Bealeia paramacronuclearis]